MSDRPGDWTGPTDRPETFAAYTEERSDARFTEWCRARSEPEWTAATEHRFTAELRTGALDDAVFKRYLVQDYAVVDALAGAFGHALGDAPSMAAKARLADFLGTLTSDETDYFERSFDALSVPEAERREPATDETTRAFRDLLGRATRVGGYAETLAVLVPAEWIYRTWAGEATGDGPDRFYLSEWIDIHDTAAFDAFVSWLRRELDREGAAGGPRRRRRLERLFRRTVELEVAFFDAPYREDSAEESATDRPAETVAATDSEASQRW